jgi:hypothetical protein
MVACLLVTVTACASAQEKINSDVWLMEQMPKCSEDQARFGIYRVVDKHEEFVPYCDPAISNYIVIHKEDFKNWVRLLTKREK